MQRLAKDFLGLRGLNVPNKKALTVKIRISPMETGAYQNRQMPTIIVIAMTILEFLSRKLWTRKHAFRSLFQTQDRPMDAP
jgi:hypothetical protein